MSPGLKNDSFRLVSDHNQPTIPLYRQQKFLTGVTKGSKFSRGGADRLAVCVYSKGVYVYPKRIVLFVYVGEIFRFIVDCRFKKNFMFFFFFSLSSQRMASHLWDSETCSLHSHRTLHARFCDCHRESFTMLASFLSCEGLRCARYMFWILRHNSSQSPIAPRR